MEASGRGLPAVEEWYDPSTPAIAVKMAELALFQRCISCGLQGVSEA